MRCVCRRFLLFFIVFTFPGFLAALRFPSQLPLGDWHKDGPPRVFIGSALYGHINGGSELFLEFGFVDLHVQMYRNAKETLSVEAYKMSSPESALAIYLNQAGHETPLADIPTRNSGDVYQIMIVCSQYYILVNNVNGSPSLSPLMKSLANLVIRTIPPLKPQSLFTLLPEKNCIPGSQRLIRGYYSLQSVFTLGHGDVLLLKNKIFAAAADYTDQKHGEFTRIIAQYPDEQWAAQAFSSVVKNLDSYLKPVAKTSHRLVFKDFKSRQGIVEHKGRRITIRINLE